MDMSMDQDEGLRDRIRQAEEFLDPSKSTPFRHVECSVLTADE